MATTEEYKNGGSASYSFSIEKIKDEDIKVAVDGTDLTYTATNPPAQTTEYTVNGSNVIFKQASVSGSAANGVRIYRETALENADSATFVAGSAIRAADLNNNHRLLKFSAQEKNQQITTSDIRDSAITSAKILDGTIAEVDIANSAITSNKIADNAVTTTEILNGAVTTDKIANDAVTAAKLADNSVNHEQIAADAVRTSEIQNNAVTTAKIVDSSVTNSKLATNSVGTSKIIDGVVTTDKLNNQAVTSAKIAPLNVTTGKIADDAVTIDKIADAAIVTNGEQASHTVDDNTFFTTAAAEARYFNASTGETIKNGDTFPDNDTTIATTAAINDRIIDLVDDVGGFVPLSNETSFPTSNPDINGGGGTVVSVKAASTDLVPSGTTVTIANGRGTGLPVIITSVPSTIPQGFGFIVETTSTDHTYAFHRLSPKATEVTTVAGKATEIGRLGTAAAVEDMSILGTTDVVADMNLLGTTDVVADMNMLATTDVISDMNTLAVTSVVNNIDTVATNVANVNTTAGSISNVNTTAGSISNVNTVAGSITNVNTTAGSIGNVNTVAGSIASVNNAQANLTSINNFGDQYQVASNNPTTDGGGNTLAAGDLYFNTSANELKVYNGSSWQGGVTAAGSFAATTGNTFTGDNKYNDGVKALFGTGSDLHLYHTGTESLIQHTGPGVLKIEGNGSNNLFLRAKTGENSVTCVPDGDVELYFDNSKKLETTSTGISVTGRVTASDRIQSVKAGAASLRAGSTDASGAYLYLDGDSNGDFSGNDYSYVAMDDQGRLRLSSRNPAQSGQILFSVANGAGVTDTAAKMLGGGAVELYYANSKKLETKSYGVAITGGIELPDSASGTAANRLKIGTGDDLQIYHDGSNSVIDNNTGELKIQSDNFRFLSSDGTEYFADFNVNGNVELYYDNSKKFETTTLGIDVTGTTTDDGARHDGDVYFIGATSGRNVLWDMSEDALEFADNAKATFGTGNDLEIFHDGNQSRIKDVGTGNLVLQGSGIRLNTSATSMENMITADEGDAVKLYFNNSKKFETTSGGASVSGILNLSDNLDMPDSAKVILGTGDDLQIYHDGSNSHIAEAGTGVLKISGSAGVYINKHDNSETMAAFLHDAGVELYHNNNKYFETATNGGIFRGTTWTSVDNCKHTFGTGDDLQIWHNGQHSLIKHFGTAGNFYISCDDGAEIVLRPKLNEAGIVVKPDDAVELYYNNSKKFQTNDEGVRINGILEMQDNHRIQMGGGDDLQLWHDGSNSNIYNSTGGLMVRSNTIKLRDTAGNEDYIEAFQNADVRLYYDNAQKLTTHSGGVNVNGYVNFNSNVTKLAEDGNSVRITTNHGYVSIGPTNSSFAHFYTDRDKYYFNKEVQVNGDLKPYSTGANLGTDSNRWANIYTNDLNLSNKGSSNDVDGTWGDWTIQEGESDLFLKNNRSGKKYKFNLMEVA